MSSPIFAASTATRGRAMHRILVSALCAPLLVSVPAAAQVVTDHLLGNYSTTDDGCGDKATQDFEIRRGIVEGPNVFCILGATRS